MLQRVNKIQYTLHGRRIIRMAGDPEHPGAIGKTNPMQQILKHLDNMQHSLYSLTPLAFRQGVVPDQIESISRCQCGSASQPTPARADYARTTSGGRGRKSKSSRRKLLRSILENTEDTFFLSSRELAKRYEVDAANHRQNHPGSRLQEIRGIHRGFTRAFRYADHSLRSVKSGIEGKTHRGRPDSPRRGYGLAKSASSAGIAHPEKIIALSKQVKSARRILIVGIDLAAD